MDELNVWYEDILIGRIWRDLSGSMGFQYEDDWIKNGFPISQQLPLAIKKYMPAEGVAHKFFANLLPEAGARSHIVRDLKIVNTDFSLLRAVGGECAGALSILPVGHVLKRDFSYKALTDEDFEIILLRKGNVLGFTSENNRPRLSLAGAQDKCALYYKNNQYYLPQDSAPSTHIVKFEIADYRHIPAYEYFLNKLAKVIDLPVVDCDLKIKNKKYFLLIKRYDRVILNDNKIRRLHQEDFCQAQGFSYEKKYQIEGGPSFQDCYKLVQRISMDPIVDAENLLKWQIFNFLAGNSDGHSKNIAFIYNEDSKLSLAPFYDLVCTRAIERIDSKLALAIGGEFDPGKITMNHWLNLAKECNIHEQYLLQLIKNIAEMLIKNITMVIAQFEMDKGIYPALQRVKKVVTQQCKKTLKSLM